MTKLFFVLLSILLCFNLLVGCTSGDSYDVTVPTQFVGTASEPIETANEFVSATSSEYYEETTTEVTAEPTVAENTQPETDKPTETPRKPSPQLSTTSTTPVPTETTGSPTTVPTDNSEADMSNMTDEF